MLIYPAIDLLDGKAVRLREGRRSESTVYDDNPAAVAQRWKDAGATRIHVVDLDGAFQGKRENLDAVGRIARVGVPLQLGGGVRDLDTCAQLIDAGVDRVVLGTAMVKQPDMVAKACARFPERIVIAVDARDGWVAVEGWAETTDVRAEDLARKACAMGCVAVLYTDIARDGTGVGANIEATQQLAETLRPIEVIASGGIASLNDLRALAARGVPAAVVGRALYEGTFRLEAAIAAGRQSARGAPLSSRGERLV
jgi:phosphoribosylformimino-5-aminoimidazole carboxamide ribotide isomerase